ncbi:CAP domain-containing protein [Streptomyces sp. NPDC089919]|uniref:CAP domain-containing protein n=1 Tax=Streptomyces sp. NPDC089919 TaxID=3155188 RepID=UPI0034368440
MGRHKTPAAKATHVLPTGARWVAVVAGAAAGAGVLAAVLIPAAGGTGLHAAAVRTAPATAFHAAAAAHPAAAAAGPDAASPSRPAAPPARPASGGHPAAATAAVHKDAPATSPATRLEQADALQKKLDSTAPAEVLSLVNQARERAGSGPLKLDPALQAQAVRAAAALPDRSTPAGPVQGTRVQQPGATGAADVNVSSNEVGAQAALNDWLGDPAVRAQVLDPQFHTMGVSSSTKPDVIWWAQLFGK